VESETLFHASNSACSDFSFFLDQPHRVAAEQQTPPFPGLRLYYPRHQHMTAGLRAFVDMLREERRQIGKKADKSKAARRSRG
jgi:hypothetical protein